MDERGSITMKKFLITAVTAALLCTAAAAPLASSAAEMPGFRFKGIAGENAEAADEGATIYIDRTKLTEDMTVNAEVYVSDPKLEAWYVSPKWCVTDSHLKLTDLLDPKTPELVVFAYAEADEDGQLIKGKYSTLASTKEAQDFMGFTCMYSSYTANSPMVPYGEASDSYALTNFNIQINKDIPAGDYKVHFITEEGEYGDQHPSEINSYTEKGILAVDYTATDLNIAVYTPYDVDGNGEVSAADASSALAAYANSSSGADIGLSKSQLRAADIDGDGFVTSNDASAILAYYAKLST